MATSSTGATTAAKEATLADFALYAGARVPVQFTNANTLEAALTLNINSTGVKDIYVGGSATSASNPATWSAGAICEFVYDGTCWHYLGSNIDGYEDAAAGQAVTDLASDIASLRDSVDLLPTYAVELNKGNGVVNATIGHYNEELSLLVELTSGKQLMFTMKKSGLGFYDRDNSQSSWTLRKAW